MFNSKEMHEKMRECLVGIDEFSTDEMRDMLSSLGCIYHVDYQPNAFSNAIAYLTNKNVIEKYGEKGHYRVVPKSRGAEVTEADAETGETGKTGKTGEAGEAGETGETVANAEGIETVDAPVDSNKGQGMAPIQGMASENGNSISTSMASEMDGSISTDMASDRGQASEKKEPVEETKVCGSRSELKEFRDKIKKCLEEDYAEIEQILDAEKTSLFVKDRDTYEDIARLLKFLEGFRFRAEG